VDIGILLLIVFVLAPLLEKLLKAGRPQPPEQPPQQQRSPRQRRPGGPQRPVPDEMEERPFRSIPSADADDDMQTAATMLPDDLWEVLTGEKRPPPSPRSQMPAETEPRAEPREVAPRPRTADRRPVEAARSAERPRRAEPLPVGRRPATPPRERRLPEVGMRRDPADTRMRPAAARRLEPPPDDFVREIPTRESAAVVPFEAPSLDPEERRAAFKARRATYSDAATVARSERRMDTEFRGTDNLRRAIIMAEILGKPRGLED
jgi:hypothetical protein